MRGTQPGDRNNDSQNHCGSGRDPSLTLPSELLERPQLLKKLQTGVLGGHRLFMVCAPAGYGKTTLVSRWLQQQSCPVVWLTLTSADNEPKHLLGHLRVALAELGIEASDSTLDSLRESLEALSSRFYLVLDDNHALTVSETRALTPSRGTTLVEVMVAGSLMLMLLGILVLFYRLALQLEGRDAAKSDVYRAMLVGSATLRSEMFGARVIHPLPPQRGKKAQKSSSLVYRAHGELSSEVTIRLENGTLIRQEGTTQTLLGHLGQDATLEVERVNARLLVVKINALDRKTHIGYSLPMTFSLRNQP